MKIQRNFVYIAFIFLIVSFDLIFYPNMSNTYQNIFISIFASSFLLFFTSLLAYFTERKHRLERFIAVMQEFQTIYNNIYLGNEISKIPDNLKLINFFESKELENLRGEFSELQFLIGFSLKNYIRKYIVERIEKVLLDLGTHVGMLNILFSGGYKEQDINAHYYKSIIISKQLKEDIENIPIDNYKEMTANQKILYHHNKIITSLISPYSLTDLQKNEYLKVLPFITQEALIVKWFSYSFFLTKKKADKFKKSSESIGELWDNLSEDLNNRIKKKIYGDKNNGNTKY